MLSSMSSSQPRGWTWISYVSCIGGQVLHHWSHRGRPQMSIYGHYYMPEEPSDVYLNPIRTFWSRYYLRFTLEKLHRRALKSVLKITQQTWHWNWRLGFRCFMAQNYCSNSATQALLIDIFPREKWWLIFPKPHDQRMESFGLWPELLCSITTGQIH